MIFDGMKKLILWLTATAAFMLALPWLAVTFIKGDGGMAACFVLFFALNPVYAIISGFCAGKNIRSLWALPILTAVFFLAGTWLLFDRGEKAFLLYTLIYLLLGIAAMAISVILQKRR